MDDKVVKNQSTTNQTLVHNFNSDNLKSAFTPKVMMLLTAVVIVGVISGFFLSSKTSTIAGKSGGIFNLSTAKSGTIVGSNDTATFKDTAEGTLKEGGIDGEGAFHLVRPGGDSQNVYLTSSNVDLSKFIGKKLKVWGQTQKAQTAGWLMDVGRVQVL